MDLRRDFWDQGHQNFRIQRNLRGVSLFHLSPLVDIQRLTKVKAAESNKKPEALIRPQATSLGLCPVCV